MTTSIIEFKLFDEVYCFNTKHVKYVFELENFNTISGFHDAVTGIAQYNEDVMLLIDTAKLYSDKTLDMDGEKSVIVIHDEQGMLYGMLVDEIVKLEEVEEANPSVDLSTEELVINHYKDTQDDMIVNEIYPLPLLEKYQIPSMASVSPNNHLQESVTTQNTTNNYLLFKVDTKMYALQSKYVKEVLENEFVIFKTSQTLHPLKGAIALRDEVVQVASLGAKDGGDLIILESSGDKVALEVDEVYDIEDFTPSEIEYLHNTKSDIEAFYNHNAEVVAILNPFVFLPNNKKEQQLHKQTCNDDQTHNMQEYLLFYIDEKKYAISMGSVRQVVESDEISKTQSSAIGQNSHIAYLTTWNHQAINVAKLDSFLDVITNNEENQVIFVENDGHFGAFIVDRIENIIYLDTKDINEIQSPDEKLILGAVIYNDEVIAQLNAKFLIGIS